jgi:hypothetical protein
VYEKNGKYDQIGYIKACSEGHLHMVKYFISIGFDVFKIWHRKTGLQVACRNGHFQLVKFLIDSGANVYQKNVRGENLLVITARSAKIIWDEKNSKYTCNKDHFQIIDFFLEQKFFNISDPDMGGILSGVGWTGTEFYYNPNYKVFIDKVDRVQYFIEKGFIVKNHLDLANEELKSACSNHNLNSIKFLLSEGCEPQIYRPFSDHTIFKQDYQALVYLFEHGAPFNQFEFMYLSTFQKDKLHLLFNEIQNRIMKSLEIKNQLEQNLFHVEKVVIDMIFDFAFGYSNLETIETQILLTISEALTIRYRR